LKAVLKIWC